MCNELGQQSYWFIAEVSYTHLAVEPRLAWWQILLALVGIVALVALVYDRERVYPGRKRVLMALRAASLLLIVWMIWGWMLASEELKLPQLWIVVDRSQSMQLPGASSADTRYEQAQRRLDRGRLSKSLAERFELRYFAMGNGIQEQSYSQLFESRSSPELVTSRLGDDLNALLASTIGQPVAAVWTLTDGRVTAGQSLTKAVPTDMGDVPVFATPLGDQSPSLDIVLRDLRAPATVIPGTKWKFKPSFRTP